MDKALQLFSSFPDIARNLYELSTKIAFVILVAGVMGHAFHARKDGFEAIMSPVVMAGIITAFIAFWPKLTEFKEGYLWQTGQAIAEKAREGNAHAALDQYLQFQENTDTLWKKLAWGLEAIKQAIVYGTASVFIWIGRQLFSILRCFQVLAVGFVFAFGPIFLSLLSLNATRSIGINFMLTTAGVFLWDFALAIVDVGTINLCQAAVNGATSFGGGDTALLYAFLIPGWVILGYLLAPFAIIKAFTTGTSIAAAMTLPVIGAAATATAAGLQLGGALAGRAAGGVAAKMGSGEENGPASASAASSPQKSGPGSGGGQSYAPSPASHSPGAQAGPASSAAPGASAKKSDSAQTAADMSASLPPTDFSAAAQILHQARSASSSGAPAPIASARQQQVEIKRGVDNL